LLPENCVLCGSPLKAVQMPSGKWVHAKCPCVVADFEKRQKDLVKREKKERIERLFENSGLGERFKKCSLDNWYRRPGTDKAYEAACRYNENISNNVRDGKGLVIFGTYGNGKSHLAAAIANTTIRQGMTTVFERVPSLLAKIRATYGGDGDITEYQLLKALTDADLVVLDDAGAEKWTEWAESMLYTVIDERYSYQKALIITTNSNLNELEKKIGIRAMDRVLEMCEIVENKGTSFRKERARLRKN